MVVFILYLLMTYDTQGFVFFSTSFSSQNHIHMLCTVHIWNNLNAILYLLPDYIRRTIRLTTRRRRQYSKNLTIDKSRSNENTIYSILARTSLHQKGKCTRKSSGRVVQYICHVNGLTACAHTHTFV